MPPTQLRHEGHKPEMTGHPESTITGFSTFLPGLFLLRPPTGEIAPVRTGRF